MRFLVTLLLFLGLAVSPALANPQPSKIYVVVFKVTVGPAGEVSDLQVSQVNDPDLPGTAEEVSKRPVDVAIPAEYIAAAKIFLSKKKYEADPRTFYTFTFYDPKQPTRADLYSD